MVYTAGRGDMTYSLWPWAMWHMQRTWAIYGKYSGHHNNHNLNIRVIISMWYGHVTLSNLAVTIPYV